MGLPELSVIGQLKVVRESVLKLQVFALGISVVGFCYGITNLPGPSWITLSSDVSKNYMLGTQLAARLKERYARNKK